MTSPVSPSDTIEKAMEGVTLLPWLTHGTVLGHKGDVFAPTAKRVTDCHHIARCFAPKPEKQIICELQAIQTAREAASVSEAIAAYIAACNPVAMREVLDELYALRKTALQLEAMKREMAEKDERIAALGLGLSSASAQLAKVHDDAFKQAAGYGLVTTDGRDFSCLELNRCETEARRAHTLIQGEKK